MKGCANLAEKQTVLFSHSITQLDQALGEIGRVVQNLLPTTLLDFGLIPALENLCTNMNK